MNLSPMFLLKCSLAYIYNLTSSNKLITRQGGNFDALQLKAALRSVHLKEL